MHFPYRYDHRLAPFWRPFLVRMRRDGVDLTDDGRFVARFGPLRVDTPITNVDGAHVTGPYRWWTAPGARLSFTDDGLTFGTNAERGVCVHFVERVRGFGPRRLPVRPACIWRQSAHCSQVRPSAATRGLLTSAVREDGPGVTGCRAARRSRG
jgi:hypothetical protein